jgi:hypothetical protein
MAYNSDEPLTLADQLQLLLKQGMSEEEAKQRLRKLFTFKGHSLYTPKYAVSYEDAVIYWDTGKVTLRRLPRQPFTPFVTAAVHCAHFPPPSDPPRRTAAAQTDTTNWLIGLMKAGPPTQSKDAYRDHAYKKFGVGVRAFDRAWANAIAVTGNEDWRRPGRKSGHRIDTPAQS